MLTSINLRRFWGCCAAAGAGTAAEAVGAAVVTTCGVDSSVGLTVGIIFGKESTTLPTCGTDWRSRVGTVFVVGRAAPEMSVSPPFRISSRVFKYDGISSLAISGI